MRFIFDPDKDKLNLANHGLSLSFAERLVWDEAYVWVDPRYPYDELRMIGLVPEGCQRVLRSAQFRACGALHTLFEKSRHAICGIGAVSRAAPRPAKRTLDAA